jgi:hypothetical protein
MPLIQRLGSASARGFGFGKTGAVYQRSVAETATASDSVTWLSTLSLDITETSTAADQIATLITALNQVTESATAADDVTTIPSYISTIAETAGATDAISSLGDQIVTVNETVTATDAVANIGTFDKAITETATGVDVTNINQTYDGELTETATGADSPTASRLTSGTIIEVVLGEDEVSRLALANGIVNETATGADTSNGNLSVGTVVTETATITDSTTGVLNYWVASIVDTTTSTAPIRTYDITLDTSGNVYITGLGDTSSIANAVLLVKYNNLGVLQWQRMLETPSTTEIGRGVTVDASGNIYIAATYDDNSTTSSRKGVLVKYDSSGNLLFQSTYQPTSTSTQAWAVALDSTGANAYSVGRLGYSSWDLYLVKHDSSGTAQWMEGLSGGGADDGGRAVVVDSSGNIIVAGSYGALVSSTNYAYALLVKYDSSGTQLYKKRFTDTTAQRETYFSGVALDSSGNIYCCGTAEYNAASGSDIIILSKFDSSANLLWTKGLYNTNVNTFPEGWGVAVDSDDMVYILGTAPNFSPDRIIIAKYDSSGTLQWQKFIAVSGYDLANTLTRPSKIVVDDGSVYVTTSSESGSPTFSLILKLPKDGSLTGTYSVGGYSVTYSDANYTEATLSYTVGNATGTNSTKTLSTTAGTASSFTSTATSTTTYL